MTKESVEDGWNAFVRLCSQSESLETLFSLFLTYGEREAIASRYVIVKALLEGKMTQREISEAYGVSIAQITRGSNALKIIDPNFKEFLRKTN